MDYGKLEFEWAIRECKKVALLAVIQSFLLDKLMYVNWIDTILNL